MSLVERLNEDGASLALEAAAKIISDAAKIATLQSEVDVVTRSHADLGRRLADAGRENVALREALTKIATFDDLFASDRLATNGSYGAFDEPGSVEIAREALAAIEQAAGEGK